MRFNCWFFILKLLFTFLILILQDKKRSTYVKSGLQSGRTHNIIPFAYKLWFDVYVYYHGAVVLFIIAAIDVVNDNLFVFN